MLPSHSFRPARLIDEQSCIKPSSANVSIAAVARVRIGRHTEGRATMPPLGSKGDAEGPTVCASHVMTYASTIADTVKLSLIAHASQCNGVFLTLHHGHFGPVAWCTLQCAEPPAHGHVQ